MILLWFILGIALIFGIARYNESNKLFWTLLFCFVMGFAGTKMVLDTKHTNEQSKVGITQLYSTQVQPIVQNILPFVPCATMSANKKVTVSEPVGQSLTIDPCSTDYTLSEVSGRTRDQPQSSLIKPPELCLHKDFLILHDSG